jgi:predicted ATPase/class 3 adenylate cyclase
MTERMLPTGTVTFLFSDMEGSTRLVQDLGPVHFTQILERHHAILREAFGAHGGVERGTQGDSFLVMFREAPAAVAAAVRAQTALDREPWPGGAPVRVRMGLHTGLGTLGGDDYVGLDVNRAARISSLAHGGQVLLSAATDALVADGLPENVSTRPLGEHRLKDLSRPERVHQLVMPGLRSEFPALHGGGPMVGNLRDRPTTFVGRDTELATLGRLLETRRLITLTGPGGTGKTRLAIQLAQTAAKDFDQGAWLVALDAITAPDLVPTAIGSVFAILESSGTTPIERLTRFLADRSILLVLDNFEQVLGAAPLVAELLEAAPGLRIVVTSRAPLRLSMEQEFPVAPLAVPEATASIDDVAAADAVQLFVDRARHVVPGFALSAEDAPAVVEICRRLDGLPLGIELAASRVGLLPPRSLAERLATRLDVPGGGSRDLPARQQTLERTIAWSHQLLDEPARRLLARLSVFAGGFRLDEAEAVGGGDVLEGLTILSDHSLVQAMSGPDVPRFRLLETIRMFARSRLDETDEAGAALDRHARSYLALAEEAATYMPGRDQVRWLDRLSIEHDNVRAALSWAVETGEAEVAHRLMTAMWRFWQFRGHISEGRMRADQVLAMPGAEAPSAWRMRAFEAAGGIAWWGGEIAQADAMYTTQLELARALGDDQGTADALSNLSDARFAMGADVANLDAIKAEAIELFGQGGDERSIARLELAGAYPLMAAGQVAGAETVVRESLRRFEVLDDVFYVALASEFLAGIALAKGDLAEAVRLGIRGLLASHEMGDVASITLTLRAAAALWLVAELPEDAAVLIAAHEAHCRRFGVQPPMAVEDWMGLGAAIEGLATAVGAGMFADEVRRGAAMTTDEVIEFISTEAADHVRDRAVSPAPGT